MSRSYLWQYGRGLDERPTGSRILLAEDDDDLRDLLAERLRGRGFVVVEARTGHELLDALEAAVRARGRRPFDLVITDHNLPGARGVAALATLRRYDALVPAVVMSAFLDDDLAVQARLVGAQAVLSKPVELSELERVVCSLLPQPDGEEWPVQFEAV